MEVHIVIIDQQIFYGLMEFDKVIKIELQLKIIYFDFILADNRTYLWKNGLETIPENLWCPKSQCTSRDLNRVTLNLSCNKSNPLICLGTRCEWRPAPYACKRLRPKDRKYFIF